MPHTLEAIAHTHPNGGGPGFSVDDKVIFQKSNGPVPVYVVWTDLQVIKYDSDAYNKDKKRKGDFGAYTKVTPSPITLVPLSETEKKKLEEDYSDLWLTHLGPLDVLNCKPTPWPFE